LKVGRRQRIALYLVAGALWTTGLAHWWLSGAAAAAGDLSAAASTWRPRLLALHGLAALLFLVVFGSLLPNHLLRTWRAGANRASGVAAVVVASLLAVSGWVLYYGSDEGVRAAAVAAHDVVGLLLPLGLAVHVALGRRWRRRFLQRAGARDR